MTNLNIKGFGLSIQKITITENNGTYPNDYLEENKYWVIHLLFFVILISIKNEKESI